MNMFDKIKNMNIDEFVNWLDENVLYDGSPWCMWFDENYCNKCEPEMAKSDFCEKEVEYGWCELNHKCKYFQDMNDTPEIKEIIKMWLLSEIK